MPVIPAGAGGDVREDGHRWVSRAGEPGFSATAEFGQRAVSPRGRLTFHA